MDQIEAIEYFAKVKDWIWLKEVDFFLFLLLFVRHDSKIEARFNCPLSLENM